MVVSLVEEDIFEMESLSSEPGSSSPEEKSPDPPTREERLAKNEVLCDNLIAYLTTMSLPHGLNKNDIRNIKKQAKTHEWDTNSKYY